ncbi:MAG: CrcB family protein [Opitutales bacterium]|nr:CrcB family protein [Opitutales bacterium]
MGNLKQALLFFADKHKNTLDIAAISFGAILGVLARSYAFENLDYVLQILAINTLGAFLYALFKELFPKAKRTGLFFATGFCASFTTLSCTIDQSANALANKGFWEFSLPFFGNLFACTISALIAIGIAKLTRNIFRKPQCSK